MILLEIL